MQMGNKTGFYASWHQLVALPTPLVQRRSLRRDIRENGSYPSLSSPGRRLKTSSRETDQPKRKDLDAGVWKSPRYSVAGHLPGTLTFDKCPPTATCPQSLRIALRRFVLRYTQIARHLRTCYQKDQDKNRQTKKKEEKELEPSDTV